MAYQIGDVATAFTLPRADGGDLTFEPGSSAATVVVFTANHCPYALAWHDRIDAVARDYADRGVTVIQVNANDETRYPADSTAASGERVDATATLVYHGAPDGDHENESENARYLRAAIEDVLADRPVAEPQTAPVGCSIKWIADTPLSISTRST